MTETPACDSHWHLDGPWRNVWRFSRFRLAGQKFENAPWRPHTISVVASSARNHFSNPDGHTRLTPILSVARIIKVAVLNAVVPEHHRQIST
jgi:hypothetical protein